MPQINVNTDLMQHMADHLGSYAEEMETRQGQLVTALHELPTYWQGHAGQAAQEELASLTTHVLASLELAKYLRQRLLKARQAFEQAGLAGLNSLLDGQESTWVPRSYSGGDQGAITGEGVKVEEVLGNVERFADNEGPRPLAPDAQRSALSAVSRMPGNQ